jgi:hypothetical protein
VREWAAEAVLVAKGDIRVELLREIGEGSVVDEVVKEVSRLLGESRTVEERIVKLAGLSSYKDYFAMLIIDKKLKKHQIKEHLPLFLSLLSRNDEYLLMILFSNHIFKAYPTLSSFFLGYCQSDQQTYDVSEPNFSLKRSPAKHAASVIHQLPHHEIFLPLMDDWFFRPLLHIRKADDANLQ